MGDKIYFAIFYKDGDGWGVRFPDAESVHTQGKTVSEALSNARDALSGMLAVGRKGREYNKPRHYEDIVALAEDGEEVFPIVADEKIMEEYKPKKRVNLMVPVELLNRADKHVKKESGLDRSKFFCKAVEAFLTA